MSAPLRWVRGEQSPGLGGLVLAHDHAGITPGLLLWAGRLASIGLEVVLPDLAWRQDPEVGDAGGLEDMANARVALEDAGHERVFALGLGLGAGIAFGAVSVLSGFAGCVAVHPHIVLQTLTTYRPIQPLDLVAGLRCPLQLHFSGEDPAEHVALASSRLSARNLVHQIYTYGDTKHGFAEYDHPNFDGPATTRLEVRAFRFFQRLTPHPSSKIELNRP